MPRLLESTELTPPVSETHDHIRGAGTATVTLCEYGDYECPFCVAAHPVTMALLDEFEGDLRMAFRHFPLSQIHPHALRAAEAAEAAGAQGRFWEMHDAFYEHQVALDDHALVAYAEAIGLDRERFVRDLLFEVRADRIREDFTSGVRSGVNATPTYFINGARQNGPNDHVTLAAEISAALADTCVGNTETKRRAGSVGRI